MRYKYKITGLFVTLKDGLLIFHDSQNPNWRNLHPNLKSIQETNFEQSQVQELFLTGLIDNYQDLTTYEKPFFMKYILHKTEMTEPHKSLDLKIKFVESENIFKLRPKDELVVFYKKSKS